jgi:EAL domain-containing protein (putative c-di-GMP-specific phosphodiesterase class I)
MTEALFRHTVPAGALIFREGEVGDVAYIVDRGRVEIAALRGGRKTVLAHLGPGELFGEMALIDEQVRSATAQAVEETTLIVVQRDQVRQKIDGADPLLSLLLKVVLDRLRQTTRLLAPRQPGTEAPATSPPGRSFEEVRQRALSTLQLERELQQALTRSEFEVYFQPIVATFTARAAGFEALIRWRHPERGLVSPSRFIDAAERSGLIVPMGLWMLRESCLAVPSLEEAAATVADSGHLFMSVNLSARQISDPELVEQIRSIIEETRIVPRWLKLEVTESVLMAEPDRAVTVLSDLKSLGVELAVDDFGTGYSSLSYLHRFPIDVVKVDRSFVSTMLTDKGSFKIVRSITRLASDLGLKVVAEGVEQSAELELLREFGCEYAQGYLFSRPLPLAEAQVRVRELATDGPGRP